MKSKTLQLIGLCSAVALSACSQNAPSTQAEQTEVAQAKPARAVANYSAADFFQTTQVFGSSINHDGSAILATSDQSGVFNLYRYPVDGSAPTQLTKSEGDANWAVSWFPKDDRILYAADQGGNELDHLYVIDENGQISDLTPGDKHRANFYGWRDDNQAFFVTTNERDAKATDLYQYDAVSYERTMLFQNDDSWSLQGISKDGRWLAAVKVHSNNNSDIYVVDLTSKAQKPQLITEHEGAINHSVYTFTPDSSKLIYATDGHGEFGQAWAYDLTGGKHELVYKADWDVSFVYFSRQGRYRIVGINADARTQIEVMDTQTGKALALPELPPGDISQVNFSADEKLVAFYINSDTSPSNLFTYKLGDAKALRLTDTLNPKIEEADLVASSVERFSSFDGLTVPGLLYKPHQASATQKVPALIWIHGGPGGQSRMGYSAAKQHLVNQGYALFAVNNRGSSGYGKTFFHLDDKRHGEDDLQDIVYGKKYLQSLDWVDSEKIAVIGGSYGGYLTMAAMAFTDEFEVGVNIFGVTNWVRTLESIPPWWESFRQSLYDELGDPATDKERLTRISPLFHADKIKNPVLVVQGANDPRVLQVESDEMVSEIRKNNVPVEYVLFDDEGHGFVKKENRIVASEAYKTFLDKYLK